MVGLALHGGRVNRGVTTIRAGAIVTLDVRFDDRPLGTLHPGVPLCVVQALWRAHSRSSLPERMWGLLSSRMSQARC